VPIEAVRRLAAAAQRRFAAASRPAGDKPAGPRPFPEMAPTLKHACGALRGAGVAHALTGAPAGRLAAANRRCAAAARRRTASIGTRGPGPRSGSGVGRSEEHTSELQSPQ